MTGSDNGVATDSGAVSTPSTDEQQPKRMGLRANLPSEYGDSVELAVIPETTVLDVKRGITNSVCCYLTCFEIAKDGRVFADYELVRDIPGIEEDRSVDVVAGTYTELSSRARVQLTQSLVEAVSTSRAALYSAANVRVYPALVNCGAAALVAAADGLDQLDGIALGAASSASDSHDGGDSGKSGKSTSNSSGKQHSNKSNGTGRSGNKKQTAKGGGKEGGKSGSSKTTTGKNNSSSNNNNNNNNNNESANSSPASSPNSKGSSTSTSNSFCEVHELPSYLEDQAVANWATALYPPAAVDAGLDGGSDATRSGNKSVVTAIRLSAWNPPPPQRLLQGDLFYLDVTLADSGTTTSVIGVTAAARGFYVNSSTALNFDPAPLTNKLVAHSLPGLLAVASSAFKERFPSAALRLAHCAEEERTPAPFVAFNWARPAAEHVRSDTRASLAEGAASAASLWSSRFTPGTGNGTVRPPLAVNESDSSGGPSLVPSNGPQPDWNGDYQAARELPRTTLDERILHDQKVFRQVAAFVDAATRGAADIVDGVCAPINPGEPVAIHMYQINKIFYTFATPNLNSGVTVDPPATFGLSAYLCSRSAALNELRSISAYASLSLPHLYTLLEAVIDYKGHRVVAQATIPLYPSNLVIYGAADNVPFDQATEEELDEDSDASNADDVATPVGFLAVAREAAAKLAIAEVDMVSGSGTALRMASCAESKALALVDGRTYLLDIARTTPVDPNFLGTTTTTTAEEGGDSPVPQLAPTRVLRPELVTAYAAHTLMQTVTPNGEDSTAANANGDDSAAAITTATTDGVVEFGGTDGSVGANGASAANTSAVAAAKLSFNINTFTSAQHSKSAEELAKDEENVKKLAAFLVDVVIPEFVDKLAAKVVMPLDGEALVEAMHNHGINSRYLGAVATACRERGLDYVYRLAEREMIAREAATLLDTSLRHCEKSESAARVVAHFLNCLFGDVASGLAEPASVWDTLASRDSSSTATKSAKASGGSAVNSRGEVDDMGVRASVLTTEHLWRVIRASSAANFKYSLESGAKERVWPVALLRSICRRCGVVVAAKRYDLFVCAQPFVADDIADLVPVAHKLAVSSKDGMEYLEAGQDYLVRGVYETAAALLVKASSVLSSVHGHVHEDVAAAESGLAAALHQLGATEEAVRHMEKAVTVYERTCGLDDARVAMSYQYLGMFHFHLGRLVPAFVFLARARDLTRLLGAPDHPKLASVLQTFARIAVDAQTYTAAEDALDTALAILAAQPGGPSVELARVWHGKAQLALAKRQFKEAMGFEKESLAAFEECVGRSHDYTVAANDNLVEYTGLAVAAVRSAPAARQAAVRDPTKFVLLEQLKESHRLQQQQAHSSRGGKGSKRRRGKNSRRGGGGGGGPSADMASIRLVDHIRYKAPESTAKQQQQQQQAQ